MYTLYIVLSNFSLLYIVSLNFLINSYILFFFCFSFFNLFINWFILFKFIFVSPLSGYTPLLQFWHFNKGIIIIIINFTRAQFNKMLKWLQLNSTATILRFENNSALVLKFLLNWPQEKVSEANGYVAVNFLFQLIFVFALFQVH